MCGNILLAQYKVKNSYILSFIEVPESKHVSPSKYLIQSMSTICHFKLTNCIKLIICILF